ncbi:DUF4129 domain-containing protein [Roseibium salinum]|uniref:DUF4129 domain-containing protein n=1 Tax=Roseibium salinum TaxID=1604349 RepID=UPI00361D79DE
MRAPVEIGEAGREYLRSTRLRGIDPEVAYFDPSAPAPDLDTRQEPERPAAREEPDGSTEEKWLIGLIAGGILAAIAYAFLRFGGGLAVSLKDNAVNPGSRRLKGQPNAPAWAEKLGTFEEILRMKDRRRALVLMTQKVLTTIVAANGILMQRSWTARDTLRHIPDRQGQLDTLRNLVMASERVQFGGRDVSEEQFQSHVATVRRLLGAGTS